MATVNLGNIKLNWKGAYNSSTAYIVDDVVSYNGSSYVCILASTGNLPTVTTYWNQMSAAGTDGTDLTSTLTTQGDIVYRDGSGLARLGAGTSGQVLQTGGSGANPSWTTMSSDVVKLYSNTLSSSVGTWYIDNIFDDTTYAFYQYRIYNLSTTADSGSSVVRWRVNTSTNTSYTTGQYYAIGQYADAGTSGSSNSDSRAWGADKLSLSQNNLEADDFTPLSGYINIYNPQNTSIVTNFDYGAFSVHSGASSIYNSFVNAGYINSLTNWTGISLFADSGSLDQGTIVVYGYKK